MMRWLDIGTSLGVTLARLGSGMAVSGVGPRPEKTLELYDFEACPFCRKVREAISILDLQVLVYPCPKGGKRYRPWVTERGGREMFPYLVDPNTGVEMYESDDIVRYLFENYGTGDPPLTLGLGPVATVTSMVASLARPGIGAFYREAAVPARPLELWSFEASPFCRLVRERLTVLELPYLLHSVARGSAAREAFIARSGKMQVPYLYDPNTDAGLFESADIVEYLDQTYAGPATAGGTGTS